MIAVAAVGAFVPLGLLFVRRRARLNQRRDLDPITAPAPNPHDPYRYRGQ